MGALVGWNALCTQHTVVMKIFSDLFSDIRRRNSGDEIFKWWNWTRRKYHASKFKAALFPAVKFPVAKFNAAKISRWGIFCSEVSGSEIYRGENPILKHWKCLILNIWKIVENSIITKERKRLHNFLPNFMFLKGKLLISSNLTLFNQKTWKNLRKNPKNKFFYHFQWDFEDIFQKQNCRSSIRFPNFSAVFDLEPKNHFFTYFAKIPGQTRRPRASDFDNSQFRIGTICG